MEKSDRVLQREGGDRFIPLRVGADTGSSKRHGAQTRLIDHGDAQLVRQYGFFRLYHQSIHGSFAPLFQRGERTRHERLPSLARRTMGKGPSQKVPGSGGSEGIG